MKSVFVPGYLTKWLWIALVALLLAACSGDDDFAERPQASISGSDRVVEGSSVNAIVQLTDRAPQDLVVELAATGDLAQFTVPRQVNIRRGSTWASFEVEAAAGSAGRQIEIVVQAGRLLDTGDNPRLSLLSVTAADAEVLPVLSLLGGNTRVGRGSQTTYAISIDRPAPSDGLTASLLLSGDPNGLDFPRSVTIPGGQSSATFLVTISENAVLGARQIAVLPGPDYELGITREVSVDVLASQDAGVLPVAQLVGEAARLGLGAEANFGISLDRPAPDGGLSIGILLLGDATGIEVPAAVDIPAGAASATFTLSVSPTAATGDRALALLADAAYSLGTNSSIPFNILSAADAGRLPVVRLVGGLATLSPGFESTYGLELDRPAPAGGLSVDVIVSGASGITVPSPVAFAAGSRSAVFQVEVGVDAVLGVRQLQIVAGSAYSVGNPSGTELNIVSAADAGLVPVAQILGDGQVVSRGASTTFVVSLDRPAQADLSIALLLVGNGQGLTVPASVTVPANASSAAVTLSVAANTPLGFGSLVIVGGTGYALSENNVAGFEVVDFALPVVSLLGPGEGSEVALFRPSLAGQPAGTNTFALVLSETRTAATAVPFLFFGAERAFEVVDPADPAQTLRPGLDALVIPAGAQALVFTVRVAESVDSIGDTAILRILGGNDFLPDAPREGQPTGDFNDRRNLRIAAASELDARPTVQFQGPENRTVQLQGNNAFISLGVSPPSADPLNVNFVYVGVSDFFEIDGANPEDGGPLLVPANQSGAVFGLTRLNPAVDLEGILFLISGTGYRAANPLEDGGQGSFLIIANPPAP